MWSLNLIFTELLMHYGNCAPFTFTVCILLAKCKLYCSVAGVLETLQFFKLIHSFYLCVFQVTFSDPVVLVSSFCSCVAESEVFGSFAVCVCGVSVVSTVLSCTEIDQKWYKSLTMVLYYLNKVEKYSQHPLISASASYMLWCNYP